MTMATVTPESFSMVLFDHDEIAAVVDEVATAVGLGSADEIRVEVDESNPLTRTHLLSSDPVVIAVDGGAFEDPRHPREMSRSAVSVVVGRLLLEALDRRNPEFGDPPPEDELVVAHRVAWDIYALGRLAHLGYPSQRQRRLYNFRNRHGFTDAADAAFDQLWNGQDLTWARIVALSDGAALPADPVPPAH
jgi:hypothetical protein